MQCPKCQFENPDEKKFCRECGAKLVLACPQCAAEILSSDKFCGDCGHKLSVPSEAPPKDLTFDEKLTKIQKYLSKGLTEKILSQRDKIEGERKQVTVMFCDMEGFTSLSERLGPEEAYNIMDKIYEILIHKVHDYEGTVNEFTGDGIMALFGAPIALEDAPQRAIRSGYAIHREMTRFSDKIKVEKQGNIPPIKMRIGIHTGPVVVGTLGNDLRVEFKAVGDTVNLASRIEGLAVPGSTYVSEDTFKLTEGLFRFEALGEYAVKGKAETVKAYRVIAPSTSRTRFDVSAEQGLTSLVGRKRELELLLDGFQRSKAGRGQAFSIVSEAGVGKSRLLYEFRKAVSNEDVIFQEGKCLSYSKGVAYHPVIDIVKSNFNIMVDDDDVEIKAKLKWGLKILDADEAQTLPYLLELLGIKDSGVDPIALSPEARKDRIIGALNRIVIKASQIRPLIMAIEDLHWIDKSSEDSFKALLDSIAGARVFLIFTYRPEYVHTWGSKSYHSQITLNRLSNRESLSMVSNLLGSESIESDLEEFILEKTEGVPFFIEEFIKSLKDLKLIDRHNGQYRLAKNVEAVSIPSTIQGVIMARVDALPEGAKEVLQTGSVIEREFSYELIKQVTGLPEQELLSRLSILKDSELLFERGIYPDTVYIFKHALTREVVYDSILTRRRKELHNKIGQSIEKIYNNNLHGHYAVLAEHFISSDNFEYGAKYCRLASKKAEKAVAFNDVIAYGEKQVSCLERLPITEDLQKNIIDASTILGLYYLQLIQIAKSKEVLDPIIHLAERQNYKRRLCQIYCILGAYHFYSEENFSKIAEYLEKAIKIGQEINDFISLVLANMYMGVCLSFNCDFKNALIYIEKSLAINVMRNVSWGISALKSVLAWNVYFFEGNIKLAYDASSEALGIANASGDIYSKTMANVAHGISYLGKGDLNEAEKSLLKGAEFSKRLNYVAYEGHAHFFCGLSYLYMNDYNQSQYHAEKAILLWRTVSLNPSWILMCKTYLTLAKVMNNEKGTKLDDLVASYDNNKVKMFAGWMSNCIGDILLKIDNQHISEAEDWIQKAIESNKRNGMMWHLAKDYALYAELFNRKGDLSRAKENLSKAIDIFKECGADGWVGKYEKELAVLS